MEYSHPTMTRQHATALKNASESVPATPMANVIRALAMDAVQRANSGHPGMPMGMADAATALWGGILKHDPAHPDWPDRDRFVLSAGHGSMLLYSLLHLTGYKEMTLDELKRFRQFGAKTAGHPEYGYAPGIETTTGPLGQGIATAVGMAIAEKLLATRFGAELVDHHTYVIAGDGDLMEGISHEAASLAGHLRLSKLIVLFDDNGISIDGPTELSVSDDQCARFAAYGWDAVEVDGHDTDAVRTAILAAKKSDKPTLIACKTTIGYGAPSKAGTSGSHGAPLGDEEISGAREALDWPHKAFDIPEDIRNDWLDTTTNARQEYAEWSARFAALEHVDAARFQSMMDGTLPDGWVQSLEALKREMTDSPKKEASRKSSGRVLAAFAKAIPNLLGGSADLTGSNLTKSGAQQPVTPDDFSGSYLYYGVREHAMGAAMNGIALHGGFIPYGGTFFVFSDYVRPAIRLGALMHQRVVYVMTHDSIGLGEDGPTHQPIEHLASLRAMPNLHVFRPADGVETAECWALALARTDGPSLLALSRQGLEPVRTKHTQENLCARGGYVLRDAENATVTLIATGSEVEIAVAAQKLLAEKDITARVVSLPCFELFDEQPPSYREEVLGKNTRKVAIEAACKFGWERYIGPDGIFIGMESFGASAPANELYEHFGITAEAVVKAVKLEAPSP